MSEITKIQSDVLEAMLQRAAEEGAKRVLHDLGLDDQHAAPDVRELRNLLTAWRDAKRTALRTLIQSLTKFALMAMAAGVAWHWWGKQ